MSTLVSIIIPTHRAEHFRNALRCAQAQTHTEIEILVSDNSESEQIHALCRQHPEVRYRRNVDGIAASNIAEPLLMARGEFVKYLFDDDLLYPHCVSTMLGHLGRLPAAARAEVVLITSARHVIDGDSVAYGEIRQEALKASTVIPGQEALRQLIVGQSNFIGEFSSVLFRRDAVHLAHAGELYDAFGANYPIGLIDVPLYARLLSVGSLLYIPQALSAFRLHDAGGSTAHANPLFHFAVSDWFRLVEGAVACGLLDPGQARTAAVNYLKLSSGFETAFANELRPWRERAQRLMHLLHAGNAA